MTTRGIGTDETTPQGGFRVREHKYTLAHYAVAGTVAPAVGDYVTIAAYDNEVKIIGDNVTKCFGRVKRVNTTDLTVVVEWLDVYAFALLPCSNLANITIGDAVIKNGDTATVADFDALSTTGNFIAVSVTATTGAGYVLAAVLIG